MKPSGLDASHTISQTPDAITHGTTRRAADYDKWLLTRRQTTCCLAVKAASAKSGLLTVVVCAGVCVR